MTGPLQGEAQKQTRRFGTNIADLERLRDWLKQEEVTHVVMESTRSYWKPVFNVLEETVGHLLRHAMIHLSFIPPRVIRELWDLSDVFGVSGQLMLDALLKGKAEPAEIAQFAQRRAKQKIPQIIAALEGHRMSDHHRKMIGYSLEHMRFIEDQIGKLDEDIVGKIKEAGLERERQLIQSAPGLKETSAANDLAEIGPDMSQFASARHISSWGGVCPGNNRSAGKNKSSHTTGGNPWLRAALTECAWAAAAKKGCFLKEKFWRITTKSGGKKAPAIVAVAHTVLSLVYEALRTGEPYQERKVANLNPGQRDRMIRHHVKRLGKLGVTVSSNPLKKEPKAGKTKNAKRT